MNVTPSPLMFKAMSAFVDAMVGIAPGKLERSEGARTRRKARAIAFQYLHDLVRLSMREGVARYLNEALGAQSVAKDEIRPTMKKLDEAMRSTFDESDIIQRH